METASIFAANNIKAYIFKRLTPLPLLSFIIRHLKCNGGVMITASHNPPEYNGYKVFWSDGAQVTHPNDAKIIKQYKDLNDFSKIKWTPFKEAMKQNLIQWITEEDEDVYFKHILSTTIQPELTQEKGKSLKIIYTPLHGTGGTACSKALQQIGFSDIKIVPEQAQPDEKFPTVSYPNPEEPAALKMATDLMKQTSAHIAMGTDPDTDRVGLALFHKGELYFPNGNQIGSLMLHYILTNKKEIPKDSYFVKSIVTTPLQEKIATHFNVKTENTLTGFKWIVIK